MNPHERSSARQLRLNVTPTRQFVAASYALVCVCERGGVVVSQPKKNSEKTPCFVLFDACARPLCLALFCARLPCLWGSHKSHPSASVLDLSYLTLKQEADCAGAFVLSNIAGTLFGHCLATLSGSTSMARASTQWVVWFLTPPSPPRLFCTGRRCCHRKTARNSRRDEPTYSSRVGFHSLQRGGGC